MPSDISRATRQSIVDYLIASEIPWAGKLAEEDFLARLYDLSELPSDDIRFRTARGDIRQHRSNWTDWDSTWVFTDRRFKIASAPDQEFLRFLCETLHPVVRDKKSARALAREYNNRLEVDDWKLVESSAIAGKPAILDGSAAGNETNAIAQVRTVLARIRTQLDLADELCEAIRLRLLRRPRASQP